MKTDAEMLEEIRYILSQPFNNDYAVFAIRAVVFGGAVTQLPDDAWEKHDDIEENK